MSTSHATSGPIDIRALKGKGRYKGYGKGIFKGGKAKGKFKGTWKGTEKEIGKEKGKGKERKEKQLVKAKEKEQHRRIGVESPQKLVGASGEDASDSKGDDWSWNWNEDSWNEDER